MLAALVSTTCCDATAAIPAKSSRAIDWARMCFILVAERRMCVVRVAKESGGEEHEVD